MRISSAIAFPLFWGMAAVAPVALPIVLGLKWAGVTLPFILLALPLPLRTAHTLATTALFGLSRPEISLYMLRPMGGPAATAARSSLSALTVGWLFSAKLPAIMVLPTQAVAGAAVYIWSLRLVSKEQFDEMVELIMRLLKRP